MKPQIKQIWRGIGVGSVVLFLLFCAIRASHLHPVTALKPRVATINQPQPVLKAGGQTPPAFDVLGGLKAVLTNNPGLSAEMLDTDSHVVSIARDLQGNIWVGTEGDGVFRYDPDAEPESQWSQFTNNNGLGDNNAYSIACDKQGRIWVGELNHGVAVFNGVRWQNYDVLDGPIGERIFRIAVCPTDGDVWMATSAGLTRYSPDLNTWRYYTRANGLPSDQANALAFDASGNLYVGTQCDGIAIGSATNGYKQWQVIPGPDQLPTTPHGDGLPSGLINDLLVTQDQKIYAATTTGLAFSTNNGKAWQYIRGSDYMAKIRDLAGDEPPDDWLPISKVNVSDLLLPEDYITCLAEDNDTNIWMGFRTQGYAVMDTKAGKMLFHGTWRNGLRDDYVTAMLPGKNFKGYIGSYGGGLTIPEASTNSDAAQDSVQANNTTAPPLPLPAKPPTLAELEAMTSEVNNLPYIETNAICPDQASAVYLGQDWRTQGDWLGRYGRQHAILSAMGAPFNHSVGWGWHININPRIGPHHYAGDSLRYWAGSAWLTTEDPRALYSPVVGHRRITEWDDHGESYSTTYRGPDIWVQVGVPEGVFRLSFYFVNYDGFGARERYRDYLLELKSYTNDTTEWENQPTLARGRVQNFCGGEYQSFIVTGPAQYQLKIGRNYSHNTMCEGVFVDRLVGPGFPPTDNSWLPYMEHVWYKPPVVPPANPKVEQPELLGARDLWAALDDGITTRQGVEMQNEFRLLAYRTASSEQAPEPLLANWRWKMPLWTAEDRTEFWEIVQKAYLGRTGQLSK